MSITLVISRGPASRASLRSAELARALVLNGERIEHVFFHGDGVALCRADIAPASDPHGAAALWQSLIAGHRLPSTACSGSLSRREPGQDSAIAPFINVAGLGQLAGALQTTDRVVSF